MNFLNLEYFLVAAQELNFTRAAKKLYISQQSLSTHILKLEEYFGASFFDRTNPITLTSQGEWLVKRANEMLCIRDATKKELHDIKDEAKGELIIGAPRALGRLILPNILPAYNKNFPNIHLRLCEGSSDFIEKLLHSANVDLAIGFLPDKNDDIDSEGLYKEKIVLVVPDQILAEQYPNTLEETKEKFKTTKDIHIIKDCSFLVMETGTKTGTVAQAIFNDLHINPKIVLESRNIETLIALCLQNMGVLLCPEVFIKEALKGKSDEFINQIQIYTLPYENTENTVAVNYLKNKYLSEPAKGFIQLAKQYFENIDIDTINV